ADCSFNKLDMPVTPFLKPFIEIRHEFEENLQLRMGLVEMENAIFNGGIGHGRQGARPLPQLCRNRYATRFEEVVKGIDHGWLVKPRDQSIVSGHSLMVLQHAFALVAQDEFQLAELR